jgi:hypothetical protein
MRLTNKENVVIQQKRSYNLLQVLSAIFQEIPAMRIEFIVCALLTAVSAGGSITYYGPSDFKKFPEYKFRVRLPDKNTWEWGDPGLVEKALALGKSKDGMMIVLFAETHGEPVELDEAFIKNFEERATREAGFRKTAGKKMTFVGAAGYELTLVNSEAGVFCFNRVFLKDQTEYMISLFVPRTLRLNRARLDHLFDVFDWMETEQERQETRQTEKKALGSSFVYHEDTAADGTKYAVSDARSYDCRVDNLIVRVSVSGHKLVAFSSGAQYNFFSIGADDKALAFAGLDGFASNVVGELVIEVWKRDFETIVKECKDKYRKDDDTLLVREIVHADSDSGAKSVTLLFVTNFIEGQPCVYRGVHYVQAKDKVVAIRSECAQGMAMTKEFKSLLNNILQSALVTVRIDDQPVDLKNLAQHVRKR